MIVVCGILVMVPYHTSTIQIIITPYGVYEVTLKVFNFAANCVGEISHEIAVEPPYQINNKPFFFIRRLSSVNRIIP